MGKCISAYIIVIMTFLTWTKGYSQPVSNQEGKIDIIQDSRIPVLIERHIQVNSSLVGVMDGYRIQIYFDSGTDSKKRAVDVRADFLSKFQGITAYLSFQEPFFKVRIGDFRIKLEADGQLQKILIHYPNAYVVRDRINYPMLGQKNSDL